VSKEFRAQEVLQEIKVNASLDDAWKAVTVDMGKWWPSGFYAGGERCKSFINEAKMGGNIYEDWGDGEGIVWYTITGLIKNSCIKMVGVLSKEWGGPCHLSTSFKLETDSDQVKITMSEYVFGYCTEEHVSGMKDGWDELMTCLKKYFDGS